MLATTQTRMPTERAGERVGKQTIIVQGSWRATGLCDVIPPTKARWERDVPLVISDETSRAERALTGHLVMLESLGEWKRVSVGHSHPQLLSEPDD